MAFLERSWGRVKWLPPRASYEFPCTTQNPTLTVDRYASNEYRNAMAVTELLGLVGLLALVTGLVTHFVPILFLSWFFFGAAVIVGVLGLPVLFGQYCRRVRRLAARYRELGAASVSVEHGRLLATAVIREDLVTRRFVVRPSAATAFEGDAGLIALPYLPEGRYSRKVWGAAFDPTV